MSRTPDRVFQAALRARLERTVDEEPNRRRASRLRPDGGGERARVAAVVVVVAITVAVGWAGIALVRQQRSDRPAGLPPTDQAATAPVSPSPTSDPLRASIAEVRGSGRLEGPITGRFSITYESGGAVLHLRDLDLGTSTARTFQLAADLSSATCDGTDVGLLHGTISAAGDQDIELRDPAIATGSSDLSYFRALAIWPGPDRDDCRAEEVSAGRITWQLPPSIRDLADSDHGPADGAAGEVVKTGGRPSRYTVSEGDRLDAVLQRFDITFTDLLYLNPFRTRGSSTELYIDEQLNLDALQRRP